MLKLKLQYFGHLMRRADSLEKILMLGKIEGRRRRGQQRMRWLDGITATQWTWVWVNSGSWWWTGRHGVLRFMGSQRVRLDWATELNWTEAFLAPRVKISLFQVRPQWPGRLSAAALLGSGASHLARRWRRSFRHHAIKLLGAWELQVRACARGDFGLQHPLPASFWPYGQ